MNELYCIKTHSQKAVIKGNIYTLQGFPNKQNDCNCDQDCVDIGLKYNAKNLSTNEPAIVGLSYRCEKCNSHFVYSGVWWICKSLFANIDEISLEEVEEILEYDLIEI